MASLVPAPFQKEDLRMGMVWLGIEWEAWYRELGFGMRPTQAGALIVTVSLGGLKEVLFLP